MSTFQNNMAARQKAQAAKPPAEPPSPAKPDNAGPGGVEMPTLGKPLAEKTDLK